MLTGVDLSNLFRMTLLCIKVLVESKYGQCVELARSLQCFVSIRETTFTRLQRLAYQVSSSTNEPMNLAIKLFSGCRVKHQVIPFVISTRMWLGRQRH